MIPVDDDALGPATWLYPAGAVVRLLWSDAPWRVVGHEDGKEGRGAVCVLVPVDGPEREIRVGYGAMRTISDTTP